MKIMICIGVAIAILLMQFGMAQNSYGEEIENENYKISRNIIKNIVKRGSITEDVISIENKGETQKTVRLSSNGGIISIIEFDSAGILIPPKNKTNLKFKIIGKELGNYTGEILITGDIDEKLPVEI